MQLNYQYVHNTLKQNARSKRLLYQLHTSRERGQTEETVTNVYEYAAHIKDHAAELA